MTFRPLDTRTVEDYQSLISIQNLDGIPGDFILWIDDEKLPWKFIFIFLAVLCQ